MDTAIARNVPTAGRSWIRAEPRRPATTDGATAMIDMPIDTTGALADRAESAWLAAPGSAMDHDVLVGRGITGYPSTRGGALPWWTASGPDRRYPAPAAEDSPEGVA